MKKIIKLLLIFFTLQLLFTGIFAQDDQARLVVQTNLVGFADSVAFSPDGNILAGTSSSVIKLWDVASGKELRTLQGHDGRSRSLIFSPDGKTLANACVSFNQKYGRFGAIVLWNVETGTKLKTYESLETNFDVKLAFSPDGKTLAIAADVGFNQGTIMLWDVAMGAKPELFKDRSDWDSAVTFSPNGKILASGDSKEIKLWDIASKAELRTLKFNPYQLTDEFSGNNFNSHQVTKLIFSDGNTIASILKPDSNSAITEIKLWDVATGTELQSWEKNSILAISSDGKTLASEFSRGIIKLWDITSKTELKTLILNTYSSLRSAAFSLDGKTFAVGFYETIRLWNAKSGTELKTLSSHSNEVKSIAFSSTGKKLAYGTYSGTIKLWDITTGREPKSLNWDYGTTHLLIFSPDGRTLVGGNFSGYFKIWDVESATELRLLEEPNDYSISFESVDISPDGKILASGGFILNSYGHGVINLWNVETGKNLKTLKINNANAVIKIAFSPDGKTLASLCEDSTIKLWDIVRGIELKTLEKQEMVKLFPKLFTKYIRGVDKAISDKFVAETTGEGVNLSDKNTGNELVKLIALDENDWAIISPDGLFDASPSARDLIHYVIGLEPISLEQMKDLYYVPGLLQKIIKGEPLPRVELFSKKDLFPDVEFSQPKAGQQKLDIKLINRGGGIGQVQVIINGKEFVTDARPNGFDPNAKETALTVSLKDAPFISGKENKIEVVTKNASGSLTNRGTPRGVGVVKVADDKSKKATPNIYAIVGGISDYTGDNLDLSFAAKDAEDFAKALELGAVKLLGDKSKVHIRLLTSNGANSNAKFDVPDAKISTATKKDFQKAFANFSSATPNDVFIVYMAGHGVSLNLNQNPNQAGGDTYLYLTQEATTTDKSVLSIKQSREAMSVSSDELKDLMKQNKALKQVLILDTCAAGALSNSLVGKRDLPSDQIRAIERLKDNTGFFVLMGSAANSVSYEASQYGQGLLTYSLLQGMKGAKLRENQFADVGLLFGYAQEQVQNMAKNIGGIQRPLIITPDTSASFDIGKFTETEQKQIPLSNPKPLILRPSLRNSKLKFDNLKLTQELTKQLREAAYAQTRGTQSQIVFVETDEMTDALQPVGDYTIEGDTLKISVILVKNNTPQGTEIVVTGKTNEPEKAIKQIVSEILKAAK